MLIIALRRLRASNNVEEDIEEMRAEQRAQQSEAMISMTELICSPTLRSPLIISIVMQLSQQLSGINAVSTVPPSIREGPKSKWNNYVLGGASKGGVPYASCI